VGTSSTPKTKTNPIHRHNYLTSTEPKEISRT
jgi:hypothetical protein